MAKIKEYIEDNLTGMKRASVRVQTPAPLDSPLSIYNTANCQAVAYDPTHQELQTRLNKLRNKKPAK
jgi:hypothetical protein